MTLATQLPQLKWSYSYFITNMDSGVSDGTCPFFYGTNSAIRFWNWCSTAILSHRCLIKVDPRILSSSDCIVFCAIRSCKPFANVKRTHWNIFIGPKIYTRHYITYPQINDRRNVRDHVSLNYDDIISWYGKYENVQATWYHSFIFLFLINYNHTSYIINMPELMLYQRTGANWLMNNHSKQAGQNNNSARFNINTAFPCMDIFIIKFTVVHCITDCSLHT